ncbi:hypothetical protein HMPREF0322_00498 [Desulfitobacterium hafniense DP7]|uniref:Uncharacterized protein n=1 Tax=Desulfitobacterium hafniense DP7 TaxID=537010 RepID=G9XHS2_DESHA|nr:hypothetical protein HMPREF0322_00498 [Desulfitobacterium hafniense DP7]
MALNSKEAGLSTQIGLFIYREIAYYRPMTKSDFSITMEQPA